MAGVCAPKFIVDWTEDKENEMSLWEYEEFLFNEIPEMREMFFKDWPADAARPDDFKGWANAVAPEWPLV